MPFSILQYRCRAVILAFGNGADDCVVAVIVVYENGKAIADFFAEHGLAERRLAADESLQRVCSDSRHDLNYLRFVVLGNIYLNLVIQSDLVVGGGGIDDVRRLYQVLKIADAAAVAMAHRISIRYLSTEIRIPLFPVLVNMYPGFSL